MLHTYMERKPFVTVNLRLTHEEHARLKDAKGKRTWEEFFLELVNKNEN